MRTKALHSALTTSKSASKWNLEKKRIFQWKYCGDGGSFIFFISNKLENPRDKSCFSGAWRLGASVSRFVPVAQPQNCTRNARTDTPTGLHTTTALSNDLVLGDSLASQQTGTVVGPFVQVNLKKRF